jgi:hypothetical protein
VSVTLDELLLLVGRLDDAPGFDSARERFRRFLLERVTDLPTARALIEDCQRSVGEQRHRALQDLITVVGRLLGFDITFGTYERSADAVKVDGQWRLPGQLHVGLEIKTEQTSAVPLERLARAVSALPGRDDAEPRIGLCVVARQCAARTRLVNTIASYAQLCDVRVISVQSLLSLADQIASERMTHGEVVKLLRSGFALDFVIDLLARAASAAPIGQPEAVPSPPRSVQPDHREPAFWVATITGNETGSPDWLLRSVIAQRRVLPICHAGRCQADGSSGDRVCFFVPRRGIVGHAQLMSIVEDAAGIVPHANRFTRIYRLADVTLYDQPVVQALRAERPFALPPVEVPLAGACLTPIARQDFLSLTRYREEISNADRARSASV